MDNLLAAILQLELCAFYLLAIYCLCVWLKKQ